MVVEMANSAWVVSTRVYCTFKAVSLSMTMA